MSCLCQLHESYTPTDIQKLVLQPGPELPNEGTEVLSSVGFVEFTQAGSDVPYL